MEIVDMLSPREVSVSLSFVHGSCITECIYVAAGAIIVEWNVHAVMHLTILFQWKRYTFGVRWRSVLASIILWIVFSDTSSSREPYT